MNSAGASALPGAFTKQSKEYHATTTDMGSVTKRLQSELMALMMSKDSGISAFPEGDNLFHWSGTVEAGAGTMYEGLKYKLTLKFPCNSTSTGQSYPYTPPVVKFVTPCFHPNVDQHGNICLDILKEKWSAVYNVRTILLTIQILLNEPNNDSPLNGYAAALWENKEEYRKVLVRKFKEVEQMADGGQ